CTTNLALNIWLGKKGAPLFLKGYSWRFLCTFVKELVDVFIDMRVKSCHQPLVGGPGFVFSAEKVKKELYLTGKSTVPNSGKLLYLTGNFTLPKWRKFSWLQKSQG